MRKIGLLIIHCSDSNLDEHDDIRVVRDWHLQRGFRDVGYHYFIKLNGDIQLGRPISKPGAHTRGFNTNSIGICFHGKKINKQQKETLKYLLANMCVQYGLDAEEDIYGHFEFSDNKTCPNMSIEELALFKNDIEEVLSKEF